MAAPREPIFVARETYRRRRLIDALRLLPVAGLSLFLAPLVGGGATTRSTALAGAFIFIVWFALIVASFTLVRLLARAPGSVGADPLEPDRPAAANPEAEPPYRPDRRRAP